MSEDSQQTLRAARDAYRGRAWADATELFLRADAEAELEIDDLEALVWAAAISARDREMLAALERVYARHSANEDHEACARAYAIVSRRNSLTIALWFHSGDSISSMLLKTIGEEASCPTAPTDLVHYESFYHP